MRGQNLEIDVRCPDCRSDAIYRYGKTQNGKTRYLCLVCNRQFTSQASRKKAADRPLCPNCGGPMHIYKRDASTLRLRCARYPECRTFLKVGKKES